MHVSFKLPLAQLSHPLFPFHAFSQPSISLPPPPSLTRFTRQTPTPLLSTFTPSSHLNFTILSSSSTITLSLNQYSHIPLSLSLHSCPLSLPTLSPHLPNSLNPLSLPTLSPHSPNSLCPLSTPPRSHPTLPPYSLTTLTPLSLRALCILTALYPLSHPIFPTFSPRNTLPILAPHPLPPLSFPILPTFSPRSPLATPTLTPHSLSPLSHPIPPLSHLTTLTSTHSP